MALGFAGWETAGTVHGRHRMAAEDPGRYPLPWSGIRRKPRTERDRGGQVRDARFCREFSRPGAVQKGSARGTAERVSSLHDIQHDRREPKGRKGAAKGPGGHRKGSRGPSHRHVCRYPGTTSSVLVNESSKRPHAAADPAVKPAVRTAAGTAAVDGRR